MKLGSWCRSVIWGLIVFSSLQNFSFAAEQSAPSTPSVCLLLKYGLPVGYSKSQEDVEAALRELANRKELATEADAMLSRLITAKSPAVLSWIGRHNGLSEDDLVREWRLYYAKMFVLPKSSQSKSSALIEKKVRELFQKYHPKKTRLSIEAALNETKKLALKRIEEMPIPDFQKGAIRSRISAVTLFWMDGFAQAKTKNRNAQDALMWGIAYDPIPNQINIGLGSLKYAGRENLIGVFAHELGHVFDPCRWSAFFDGLYPFASVMDCLRSSESVGAALRDDHYLDAFLKQGKLSELNYQALKANPTCNKLEYPPVGIQADQIGESFADWFAAEVLGMSDSSVFSRADLCLEEPVHQGSPYPAVSARLEKIYFAHPGLRKAVKFPADFNAGKTPRYCTLKSPSEEKK